MENIREKAKSLSIQWHNDVNQKYGGNKPYSFHLDMVEENFNYYIDKVSLTTLDKDFVYCAMRLHDTIEDAQKTFNDVKRDFNEDIAQIVYNVSGFGKDRFERNMCMYLKSYNDVNSVFVKLCDHLANFKNSTSSASSMANKYQSEYPLFRAVLRKYTYDNLKVIWDDCDLLHGYKEEYPSKIV